MCGWIVTNWVTKIDYAITTILLFLNFIFIIALLFIRTSFVLLYIHIIILLAMVLMQYDIQKKRMNN